MRLVLVSRWLWRWLTRPCWSADGTPGLPMGLMQESWSVHLYHGCCAVRAKLWTALLAP